MEREYIFSNKEVSASIGIIGSIIRNCRIFLTTSGYVEKGKEQVQIKYHQKMDIYINKENYEKETQKAIEMMLTDITKKSFKLFVLTTCSNGNGCPIEVTEVMRLIETREDVDSLTMLLENERVNEVVFDKEYVDDFYEIFEFEIDKYMSDIQNYGLRLA